ncbi:hypothetical protein GS636_12340 [Ruegeria sp. HKCCD4884]|uniref:hypothetical protein n=1 Tax=Ruegeria sp. HKCCD4884 TaxID=2683022 RepID=UPI001491D9CF|nr:hypothetical protein [Ruegeria sp. HKCCD4884]NOD93575.1 hypothetical protein [Ruegeria sp. HKCCD4884]
MFLSRLFAAAVLCGGLSSYALAQSDAEQSGKLFMELNTVEDIEGSCRFTFLVKNETGHSIDNAVFETVLFDVDGGLLQLSIFRFGELPADKARVRQFELPNLTCASVRKALINGAQSCVVDGSESEVCEDALSPSSRVDMELLG